MNALYVKAVISFMPQLGKDDEITVFKVFASGEDRELMYANILDAPRVRRYRRLLVEIEYNIHALRHNVWRVVVEPVPADHPLVRAFEVQQKPIETISLPSAGKNSATMEVVR